MVIFRINGYSAIVSMLFKDNLAPPTAAQKHQKSCLRYGMWGTGIDSPTIPVGVLYVSQYLYHNTHMERILHANGMT